MRRLPIVSWMAAFALWLPVVATAARLEVSGAVQSRRSLETEFASALRAPRDSTALAAALTRVLAGLEDEGYLDAHASAAWDSASEWVLHLVLDPGPRYRLASLAIDSPSREDSSRFAASLDLQPGGWVSPALLAQGIERAVREAADHGNPYATLGVSAFRWDSAGAHVRLGGSLGPAVTISRVRLDGMRVTRPALAERAMGRLAGTPFSQAAAVAAGDRLRQLGLFRGVEYQGLDGEGDWRQGQLVYRVDEPRYNRFEGAVGVQSEGRAVGAASLALDNLAGTGRALALRWASRGRGVAEFAARYAEPLLFGAPLNGEATLEQHNEDTLYTRTRWGGRLGFTLSERERVSAGYSQERVVQALGEVEEADLQTTEFSLERDGRDSPLTPRHGSLVRIAAAQIFKSEHLRPPGRRSARASAVEAASEWHRRLSGRSGLTFELSGAARFSSQRVLPIFERYPVGGATSLRGQDEQAFHVDRYALAQLEWRWFLNPRGEYAFLFWDHAIMGTRLPLAAGGDAFEIVQRDGVGFGLRLEAAGGTVGVDYGLEPGRAPLEGKIHLRLISTF
jgi:outer membrane protein assembly factor BamA